MKGKVYFLFSCFLVCFFASIFQASAAQFYEYQNAAGRVVRSLSPPGDARNTTPAATSTVNYIENCRRQWENNFEMREYCRKNQREAMLKIGRYDKNIVERCRDKWPDNYEMIEYCAKNQSEAKRRLGE